MFGAIYVGLSGLNAYSQGLQQVSNNVTNMNSSGFKGSTVSFNDLVSVSSAGGLSYSNGGPASGNGVEIGEPTLNFKQGDLRQTDRDLDLAIDGSGFFVLMRGDDILYTRTGSFQVDKDGYIVLAGTDYRLATLDSSGRAVSLSIDESRTSAPEATTTIKFADNLSSTATAPFTLSDVKVYDAKGTEHVWKIEFAKSTGGAPDEWTVTVKDGAGTTIGTKTLKFVGGVVDVTTNQLLVEDTAAGLSVTLDFSQGVTSFSSGTISTLRAASVNGHKLGTITSVQVNEKGELEIGYSNEEKKQLGSIAIADFRDPQALEQRSGGLFVDNRGLAQRQFLTSQDGRVGRIMSRRLEASNVDLARQFGDLILIQRGFQASSQIISVANDMIQQLFGIRGQG